MPDVLTLSRWAGMAGAIGGAMLGAYALTQVRTTLRRMGLAPADDTAYGLSEYRAMGGHLLAGHALTAALLMQAPKVGACFAGALSAAWFGAAFGRVVSMLRDKGRAPLGFLLLDLALALLLAAPLWTYVRLIRIHAGL
jgi:hypothetical protein